MRFGSRWTSSCRRWASAMTDGADGSIRASSRQTTSWTGRPRELFPASPTGPRRALSSCCSPTRTTSERASKDHQYEQRWKINDGCQEELARRGTRPPECEPYSIPEKTKPQGHGADDIEHARLACEDGKQAQGEKS